MSLEEKKIGRRDSGGNGAVAGGSADGVEGRSAIEEVRGRRAVGGRSGDAGKGRPAVGRRGKDAVDLWMHTHNQIFQSIEDIDANAYLVCTKSPDSFESNRGEATQTENCGAFGFFDQDIGDCFIDEIGNGSSDNDSAHEQEDDCHRDDDDNHQDCYDNHFGGEVHGDLDYELTIGKVFVNEDDAYNFYNLYARLNGFGIRKHWATKSRTTRKLIKRQFVCNKEGFRSSKDKRQIGRETKRRRETRTCCGAMMGITLSKSREWVVDKFLDTHNHDTNTPSKVIKHRSHRKFHRTTTCKKLIIDFNKNGLRPCQIAKTVNALMTGHELEITRQQCSQVLSIERKNNVGKECHGIIKHFQEKAVSDVRCRRKAEEDKDFMTINSKAVLATKHPIEAKARECYTRNMFEIFKKEWTGSFNCYHETLSKWEGVIIYSIGLVHMQKKCIRRTVEYNSLENVKATCTCGKFETYGILFKHILYIMRKKKLLTLPEFYILPR
ncbi:hypothetical protein RJ640_001356 [Escallonia rubra]|uniref:Zinc finger PMZ-type domain-containing protein n=1 Tax=Escallonia rubra TaxID=112253 RepID=A0AA88ULA9_9ASTE|nr:hypothetical protein RJ640_001356 [Escallonia rubra]